MRGYVGDPDGGLRDRKVTPTTDAVKRGLFGERTTSRFRSPNTGE